MTTNVSSINASLVHISGHGSGNTKQSRPSYLSPTSKQKFSTPVTQLIAIANPNLGLRQSRKAKASSDNNVTFKHQSCPENPHRRLWNVAESILTRIQVLEQFDQDYSHSDRSSTNEPTLTNNEAERSLYKIMEAALARVSVLEKRKDISYSSAFKASNGTECIIRGCGGDLSKREHAVRHIKTTSTPEHQVAAIVLQQTKCLECGKSWKTPSGLIHHETTAHGEAYTSRMDIFRPLFEQSTCTRLALMIRKHLRLFFTDSVGGNPSKQSSHSQIHDAIPSPTVPLGLSVPSAVSASENSTPSSAPEIHHLSQTPVYCPQPDWPESAEFNAFTDAISANSAQPPTPIAAPSYPIYCPQPEWSEPNDFQPFTETTRLAQVPQSGPAGYSLPEWSGSNDFSPNEAPANLTRPSLSTFSNFPLDSAGCQQPVRPEVSSLQSSYAHPSNGSSNVYQSSQPACSAY